MNERSPSEVFMEQLVLHQSQLFGYIFALVQDLHAAQDVFQQTSLVLWRKFETFDGSNFAAWACRTAQLEALSYLRSERRRQAHFGEALLEQLTAKAATNDGIAENRRAALDSCLQKLPAEDRALIDRCYTRTETLVSIAEHLGRSAQSLNNSLRRIRRALYECIHRTLRQEGRA